MQPLSLLCLLPRPPQTITQPGVDIRELFVGGDNGDEWIFSKKGIRLSGDRLAKLIEIWSQVVAALNLEPAESAEPAETADTEMAEQGE